jgi:hypothetical protein
VCYVVFYNGILVWDDGKWSWTGGWQRIVYKVACLIHIMGPGTEYETQVCAALERLNAESLLAIVQLHLRVVHEHLS